MLVYRIQKADGTGPYRDDDAMDFLIECRGFSMFSNEQRPGPQRDTRIGWDTWDDFKGKYGTHIRFGFADLTQLRKWFNTKKVANGLHRLGFAIYVISVNEDDCLIGATQVAFSTVPLNEANADDDLYLRRVQHSFRDGEVKEIISLKYFNG